MTDTNIYAPDDILAFWFEQLTPEDWFRKSDALDDQCRRRFAATHLALAASIVPKWRASPSARLAAIILLDQIPRNIYRGTALAFATDGLARALAVESLDAGADQAVAAERRMFFYMPLEHSEDIDDQNRSVALFEALGNDFYLRFAKAHRDVIARFGRFPHRNVMLGRSSTEQEEAYLQQPGAGF